MALVVEDGTGVLDANSYTTEGFANSYLQQRNRLADWTAKTEAERLSALIAATDYIDRRWGPLFLGYKEHNDLSRPAEGYLTVNAVAALAGQMITVGSRTYTLIDSGVPGTDEALVGADVTSAADILAALVNGGPGAGVNFGAGTTQNLAASARSLGGGVIQIQARAEGESGDGVPTSSSTGSLEMAQSELTGGESYVEQPLEWPRLGVRNRAGYEVEGIPLRLKQATVEYAERAADGELLPDPSPSSSSAVVSGVVTEQERRIGPITTRTKYSSGGSAQASAITRDSAIRHYPIADRLLDEYIRRGGAAIR